MRVARWDMGQNCHGRAHCAARNAWRWSFAGRDHPCAGMAARIGRAVKGLAAEAVM
jgi:hypothetical protein